MNKKIKEIEGDIFECPLIYKDFWSSKVLHDLNEKIEKHFAGFLPAVPQYAKWPETSILDSGPILIIQIPDDEKIITDIKSELSTIYDIPNLNFYCGIHIFLSGSYIPWHDDEIYKFVTTTYLNQEPWDWNWGGALLYENKNKEIMAEFPEYNKMIVQSGGFNVDNNMSHTTTITSSLAAPRVTLQTFFGPHELNNNDTINL